MGERLAVYLSIVILAFLAGGTYWAVRQTGLASQLPPPRPPAHEADYFADRFTVLRTGPDGMPTQRLAARAMVHFPDDDSVEVTLPRTASLSSASPSFSTEARKARISSDGQRVELSGDVRLSRSATAESPEMAVRTQTMVLLPDDDIAKSDDWVDITHGASTLRGKGMEFNNTTRRLTVGHQVSAAFANREPRRP